MQAKVGPDTLEMFLVTEESSPSRTAARRGACAWDPATSVFDYEVMAVPSALAATTPKAQRMPLFSGAHPCVTALDTGHVDAPAVKAFVYSSWGLAAE